MALQRVADLVKLAVRDSGVLHSLKTDLAGLKATLKLEDEHVNALKSADALLPPTARAITQKEPPGLTSLAISDADMAAVADDQLLPGEGEGGDLGITPVGTPPGVGPPVSIVPTPVAVPSVPVPRPPQAGGPLPVPQAPMRVPITPPQSAPQAPLQGPPYRMPQVPVAVPVPLAAPMGPPVTPQPPATGRVCPEAYQMPPCSDVPGAPPLADGGVVPTMPGVAPPIAAHTGDCCSCAAITAIVSNVATTSLAAITAITAIAGQHHGSE